MVFPINNKQPAIGNVVISPSPLSSPRRVEEILIINCHLPIVVFGRPHRVTLTDNLALLILLFFFGRTHRSAPTYNRVAASRSFKLMDYRLRGNDISCLQRYFILSFLHLNKSGVNSNSNLKTGCLPSQA